MHQPHPAELFAAEFHAAAVELRELLLVTPSHCIPEQTVREANELVKRASDALDRLPAAVERRRMLLHRCRQVLTVLTWLVVLALFGVSLVTAVTAAMLVARVY
jgi:hypothetical protein